MTTFSYAFSWQKYVIRLKFKKSYTESELYNNFAKGSHLEPTLLSYFNFNPNMNK